MFKDIRGVEIKVGDRIVYGKSSRYKPVGIGTITRIEDDKLFVLGDGNKKEGEIGYYCDTRVLVLPKDY